MKLYLDTSILRLCVEANDAEHDAAVGWIERAEKMPGGTLLSSQLARAECLVMPIRQNNEPGIAKFENFFRDCGLVIVSVSDDVVALATRIRAHHHLKMPDAIHVASAIAWQCDGLVAKDRPLTKKDSIMGLKLWSLWD